jgi:hypothetical protein
MCPSSGIFLKMLLEQRALVDGPFGDSLSIGVKKHQSAAAKGGQIHPSKSTQNDKRERERDDEGDS